MAPFWHDIQMSAPGPIAQTRAPPYFAVIFTSVRTETDEGYAQTADQMVALAAEQPGYLGVESARDPDGVGITVSYWESAEAITAWKRNADHLIAQRAGKERWYRAYATRICRVERAYGFERGPVIRTAE